MTYDKRIILVAMLSCPLLPPACSRCDAASALEIYAAAESADDEADTEEEASEAALMEWRYVEFEDLEVDDIYQALDD